MDDATEETRDAILDVARKNLDRLMAGKSLGGSKKASKKPAKATKKASKKAAVKADKKSTKKVKADPKAVSKVTKIASKIEDKIARMRDRFDGDDLAAEKKKVAKIVSAAGGEFVNMNRNFSIVMRVSGAKVKVMFRNKGPVIKTLAA